jgi:hypothetical protein
MRALLAAGVACSPPVIIDLPGDHASHILLAAGGEEQLVFAVERGVSLEVGVPAGDLALALLAFDEPLAELGLEHGPVDVGPGRPIPAALAEVIQTSRIDGRSIAAWEVSEALLPPFTEIEVPELSIERCFAGGGCFTREGTVRVCKLDCTIDPPVRPTPPSPPDPVIPPDLGPCRRGWTPIGDGGCRLFLPDPPICAGPREAAFYGSAACTPLDRPCTPPSGANVLRVPADFPSISAAAAAAWPGDVIHVDGGSFTEDVVIDAGVGLFACPEAALSGGIVVAGPGARVEGLIVEGSVAVGVAGSATIADVTILGGGLIVQGAADVVRAVVRSSSIGVAFDGGPSSIRDCVIEGGFAAVDVRAPVRIDSTAIRSSEVGVFVGAGGAAVVRSIDIRDVASGIGVGPGSADIEDALIRAKGAGVTVDGAFTRIDGADIQALSPGIAATGGSTLSIDRAYVDAMRNGPAIVVVDGAVAGVARSRIDRVEAGVLSRRGAVTLIDVIIDGILASGATAIYAGDARLRLERVELRDGPGAAGISLSEGATMAASDIRGSDLLLGLSSGRSGIELERAAFWSAQGVYLSAGTATITDLELASARGGLGILDGASVTLARARIVVDEGQALFASSYDDLIAEDLELRVDRVAEGAAVVVRDGDDQTMIARVAADCGGPCVVVDGTGRAIRIEDLSVSWFGEPFASSHPGGLGLTTQLEIRRASLLGRDARSASRIDVAGMLMMSDVLVEGGLDGLSLSGATVADRLEVRGSSGTCLTAAGSLRIANGRVRGCGVGVALERIRTGSVDELEVEESGTPLRFIE